MHVAVQTVNRFETGGLNYSRAPLARNEVMFLSSLLRQLQVDCLTTQSFFK